MSSKDYPSDFFRVNRVLQRFVGFWTPEKFLEKTLYYTYVVLSVILVISLYVCEYIILQETSKDLNKFFRQVGMFLTHSAGIVKFYILFRYRERIKNMMDDLQNKEYVFDRLDGVFEPGLMLRKAKRLTDIMSITIMILYSCVGTSSHISSTVTLNMMVEGEDLIGSNMTCYDFLPYYFYIPVNVETKSQCQVVLSLLDAGLGVFSWIIAAQDGVFITLMNSLKSNLEIVKEAFRTIRERCLNKLNLPADYSVFLDENNQELENELYAELSHCTKYLNMLLQVRDDIEEVFTFGTLAQTLSSLIVFASCLYVASIVPMTSPDFFSQMEYFICVLVQLSVMCYFGNEVTIASAQTGVSLYECDWFSSSIRFKRSMILTMSRIQRPVYISIGKFSPLTLATLVAVCRGSFSYFTLFKSIQ